MSYMICISRYNIYIYIYIYTVSIRIWINDYSLFVRGIQTSNICRHNYPVCDSVNILREFEPPKRTMWRYGAQRVLHLVLQEHWTSSSDVGFPPRSWVCDHILIQNDRCWWDMSWDGIQSWLSWPKRFILPFLCIGMYTYIYIYIYINSI